MEEKWYKKDDKIIIEIPYWSKRYNPYMEGVDVGNHQTLTGLIIKEKNGWEEWGFAKTIDMDYKDKADQYTDIYFKYGGSEKEFKILCKEWKIPVIEINEKFEEI